MSRLFERNTACCRSLTEGTSLREPCKRKEEGFGSGIRGGGDFERVRRRVKRRSGSRIRDAEPPGSVGG